MEAGGAHLKVVTTLLLGRGEPRSKMVLVKGWPSFSQVKLKPKGEASITWKSRTLHTCSHHLMNQPFIIKLKMESIIHTLSACCWVVVAELLHSVPPGVSDLGLPE